MQTLRYAWRSLAKSPGFAVMGVLALALGLGLSTTMFGVIDAIVHPYSAFHEPERLYNINWWFGRRTPMRAAELYRFFRDNTTSYEGVVGGTWAPGRLERDNRETELFIRRVTPGWFTLVGVQPVLGRSFNGADGEDVIVLGHELYRRYFGQRKDLAGAVLQIEGRPVTVVGIMPEGVGQTAAWMPLTRSLELGVTQRITPTVRLRAGVTREQADAELKALARMLTDRFQAQDAPFGFELAPYEQRNESIRDIHKAMLGAALAVLLIACVNLAHLMLARGLAKRREFALRMAIGASRGAIVRQMFTECAMLTLAGAALGALLALWGADLLTNRMPREVTWVGLIKPQLSWRVFALGAGAATLSAVLFGLLPALRVAFAVSLDEPLKDDSGTTTGRVRLRYNPLVMTEVALALALLMGGGLLLRTVRTIQQDRTDYDEQTLWRAYLNPRRNADSVAVQTMRDHLLATVRHLPGVRDAALSSSRRAPGNAVSGEQTGGDSTRLVTMDRYPIVSTSYLSIRGLPILRGRNFEEGDAAGRPVAIIDALAAQRLYPAQEAVGRMLKLGSPASDAPWVPIVGVVRSPRNLEGDGRYTTQPHVFVSMTGPVKEGMLLIRTTEPNPRTVTQLTRRLSELPGVAAAHVIPYDYARQADIISRGFLARVFVAMGAVALGLSMLGLYGVLSYSVGRRMREFAVRVALGASSRMLLKMVLHDGVVMLLAGIGVGAFVALATSRLLDAVLISVLPSDVITLVLSEAVLVLAGLAAAVAPARRAAAANPLDILRAV